MKTARDRQKSYADNRRKPLEFSLGDKVLLKVSPWKGIIRFVEEPIKVMDRDVKKLKQSKIFYCKSSLELSTRTRIYLGTRRRD
ncbi:hypothetical protein Tco_0733258 [Tanacetum coccineum]